MADTVYAIESASRRSEVEERAGHFKVWFGQDGEWHNLYRVTDSLEKAKEFADGWISENGNNILDLTKVFP